MVDMIQRIISFWEVFKVDKETVENAMNSAKDKFTEIMSKFKGLK